MKKWIANIIPSEILNIDFKIHQSYMYTLNEGSCKYSFTPGWFNDINVRKLTIKWKSDKISDYDNEAMREGRDLEDYVARRFSEET